jgi:signal transduction histidine kinase
VSGLRALVDRYLELYNARDLGAWSELLAEDVRVTADAGVMVGRAAACAFAAGTQEAFPGLHAELDRIVVEGEDTIVAEYRLVNRSPSDSAWRLSGTVCDIYEVRDGLIAEVHSYYLPDAQDRTGAAKLPSRMQAAAIADERAALARVAALVARGVSRDALFAAVNEELAGLVDAESTAMLRFEPDDTVTLVAGWSATDAPFTVGDRQPVEDDDLRAVRDSGSTVRFGPAELPRTGPFVDEARRIGIRTAVGVPIAVDGRVWGVSFVAARGDEPFPADTEARIASFTELVATSIANAQARAELQCLVEEQRALRQVATLAAGGAPPAEILDEVVVQAARVLGLESAALLRFDADGTAITVANHGTRAAHGMRVPDDVDSIAAQVLRSGRPSRIDDYEAMPAAIAGMARGVGMRAAVGAPIVVAGRVWGVILAMSPRGPLPSTTEDRLMQFAELVATAIGNAESRAELTASRARVVAAADESRRRIQRDLHDGAQQRLVHAIISLKLAKAAARDDRVAELVAESLGHAESATTELRELVQGIIPTAVGHGGLRAGVESLVGPMDLPVRVDMAVGRLPAQVETTAYFVVAEALTNTVKHAGAGRAYVRADVHDGALDLVVGDDGAGGADPARGSGLVGLADRVAATGGTLSVTSPPGAGTTVAAVLPLGVNGRRYGHGILLAT